MSSLTRSADAWAAADAPTSPYRGSLAWHSGPPLRPGVKEPRTSSAVARLDSPDRIHLNRVVTCVQPQGDVAEFT
jgi:hypothetical protein